MTSPKADEFPGEVVSLELDRSKQVVVAGAGGFIGGHLVAELKRDRKSVVSGKRVDLGGRRIIKKKTAKFPSTA